MPYTVSVCVCLLCCVESSRSDELGRKLAEAERVYAAQLTLLQQKLQEETEKRHIQYIHVLYRLNEQVIHSENTYYVKNISRACVVMCV